MSDDCPFCGESHRGSGLLSDRWVDLVGECPRVPPGFVYVDFGDRIGPRGALFPIPRLELGAGEKR